MSFYIRGIMETIDSVFKAIDGLSTDSWGRMENVLADTHDLIESIGADARLLGNLIEHSRQSDTARKHFERHRLLDKIHLYESPSGVRLRLHLSTQEHRDRPHDHRFSFVSTILAGGYLQTRHKLVGDLSGVAPAYQNDSDAPRVNVAVVPLFQTFQAVGSTYSLHHSEIHTTFTQPQSVSLFLRGPAEKDRSIITERESGTAWWRYGREAEPTERRTKVQMSEEYLCGLVANLTAIGVVK